MDKLDVVQLVKWLISIFTYVMFYMETSEPIAALGASWLVYLGISFGIKQVKKNG